MNKDFSNVFKWLSFTISMSLKRTSQGICACVETWLSLEICLGVPFSSFVCSSLPVV